jgi:AcrR family transcriptional regulator
MQELIVWPRHHFDISLEGLILQRLARAKLERSHNEQAKRRRARTRRPQARGFVTRARLLKVARELFSRDGYAAVSRADVAREAGCGMSTAYYHFPSRRSMLLELIDEWGKAMPVQRRAAFDIRTALGGDPRRAARDFLRKSYEALQKGSSFYRVILAEAERDPEVRRRYEAARQAITTWMAEMTHIGQFAGRVRTERKPEATAFLLHHVIESALTELVAHRLGGEFREEVLDELVEMICSYLLVSPAAPALPR